MNCLICGARIDALGADYHLHDPATGALIPPPGTEVAEEAPVEEPEEPAAEEPEETDDSTSADAPDTTFAALTNQTSQDI